MYHELQERLMNSDDGMVLLSRLLTVKTIIYVVHIVQVIVLGTGHWTFVKRFISILKSVLQPRSFIIRHWRNIATSHCFKPKPFQKPQNTSKDLSFCLIFHLYIIMILSVSISVAVSMHFDGKCWSEEMACLFIKIDHEQLFLLKNCKHVSHTCPRTVPICTVIYNR